MRRTDIYIGLISGTSMDAIDAVAVDFSGDQIQLLASESFSLHNPLKAAINQLCFPGQDDLDTLGRTDRLLGEQFAQAALNILEKAGISADAVAAIGSHGQTVRHRPPQKRESAPFSLQIGDPNTIVEKTGITTVADFRRRDMALGGQGAPMVCAFHQAIFHSNSFNRAIINVGGIANITWLPASGEVLGFDSGPGNTLMDQWYQKHWGEPYDENGQWASGGDINGILLAALKQHDYLNLPIPRSTGREDFNLPWLEQILAAQPSPLDPQDVQATLLRFTAETIADALNKLDGEVDEVYICGGGAFNNALMQSLADLLQSTPVASTSALGLDPGFVEAIAFAWLACQTINRRPGNLPSVTGARRKAILGGIYYP